MADTNESGPYSLLGKLIAGRFEVRKVLGSGGMGWVYAAHDRVEGAKVAVKVLPSMDQSLKSRFLQESCILRMLDHPNVVRYQAGGLCTEQQVCYLAMEYMSAPLFEQILRDREQHTLSLVMSVLLPTLKALHHIHTRGILHRDLKPGNICANPHRKYVRVFDFGIAKILEQDLLSITQEGQVCGTPHFLAPEQLQAGILTPQTDLYSFGVMLYWVLAGRLPFEGTSLLEVCDRHMYAAPDALDEVWALEVPVCRPFVEVTHQLLEKDPNKRPQSAKDVFLVLAEALREDRDLRRSALLPPVVGLEPSPREALRSLHRGGDISGYTQTVEYPSL